VYETEFFSSKLDIKRRRIQRRFQNYKLTVSDKIHLKKLLLDKDFHLYTGAPLYYKDENLYKQPLFLGAFCHKGKFLFLYRNQR
jgi:hypothetical protein